MENEVTRLKTQNSRFEPVFVIGEFHSGAFLLTRLLSKYFMMHRGALAQLAFEYQQKLASFGDLKNDRNLENLLSDILNHGRLQYRKKQFRPDTNAHSIITRLHQRDLQSVFAEIFGHTAISQQNSGRWVDEIHEHQPSLKILKKLFPTARFIHIVRDGRDVALCHFRSPNHVKNCAFMALKWKHRIALVEQFARTLPAAGFMAVRYEDILSDSQAALEGLRKFLGINDPEGILQQQIMQHIHHELPLDFSYMWRYELTFQEQVTFEKVAAGYLSRFDYETINQPLPWPGNYSKNPVATKSYTEDKSMPLVG
jgi:hypothetical protein